jgi:hypothetical protein
MGLLAWLGGATWLSYKPAYRGELGWCLLVVLLT